MTETQNEKDPIINAHTHIFTHKAVPPFIAKTFVPSPLHYLIHLPTVMWFFKQYLKRQRKRYEYGSFYRRLGRLRNRFNIVLRTNLLLRLLWRAVSLAIFFQAFFGIHDQLSKIQEPPEKVIQAVDWLRPKLTDVYLLYNLPFWVDVLMVLVVIIFFKSGRNLLLFSLKRIWKFLGILPGKSTRGLIERYKLMGRFAIHDSQGKVKTQLTGQYEPGTGFVLLPMDMKYMDAGRFDPKIYHDQMKELKALKIADRDNALYPFVFVDPRRIKEEKHTFFDYTLQEREVVLKEGTFIQEYIEKEEFSGFKIYPALGYYPFDEELLLLWKYAADNEVPIMTHCIKGVIFFRGRKMRAWDRHPVFKEMTGATPNFLPLPEKRNVDFTGNFTHPLNYLCLLEEPLLRLLVADAKNPDIKKAFGYNGPDKPMTDDLSKLKVCLAHFGGEPEWEKYLEMDRDNYAQSLIRHRGRGIDLKLGVNENPRWGLYEQLWKNADWYSLICSMLLQYSNVYADISFMISKPQVYPLLRETLNEELNKDLREKVLYGTDFYVVRNIKSDKNIITEARFTLEEDDFDQIARVNPKRYLKRKARIVEE